MELQYMGNKKRKKKQKRTKKKMIALKCVLFEFIIKLPNALLLLTVMIAISVINVFRELYLCLTYYTGIPKRYIPCRRINYVSIISIFFLLAPGRLTLELMLLSCDSWQ